MKNRSTKLDKAVKISIILGILIVALSVANYFIIFLPKEENGRKELQEIKEVNKREARKYCNQWAIDKAQNHSMYNQEEYDDYFARCLREQGY